MLIKISDKEKVLKSASTQRHGVQRKGRDDCRLFIKTRQARRPGSSISQALKEFLSSKNMFPKQRQN